MGSRQQREKAAAAAPAPKKKPADDDDDEDDDVEEVAVEDDAGGGGGGDYDDNSDGSDGRVELRPPTKPSNDSDANDKYPVLRHLRGHTTTSRCVSGWGGLLVTGSFDKTLRLWDPRQYRALGTLSHHSQSVFHLLEHPERGTLLSGAADHTICEWAYPRTADAALEAEQATGAEVEALAAEWRAAKPIRTLTIADAAAWVYYFILHPRDSNRLYVATSRAAIEVWDFAAAARLCTLRDPAPSVDANYIWLSFCNGLLWAAASDGVLRGWDVDTDPAAPKLVRRYAKAHSGWIYTLAADESTGYLYSSGKSGDICCWDTSQTNETLAFVARFTPPVTVAVGCMATVPGGRLLTVDETHCCRLWNLETRERIESFTGHNTHLVSFCIRNGVLWTVGADGGLVAFDFEPMPRTLLSICVHWVRANRRLLPNKGALADLLPREVFHMIST